MAEAGAEQCAPCRPLKSSAIRLCSRPHRHHPRLRREKSECDSAHLRRRKTGTAAVKAKPSPASQLKRLLGADAVSTTPEILQQHATDKWFASREPEVVVFARTTEDVSKTLRFANARGIPVTPRGAGVGYVGGCVPVHGGIALSLARMTRIKEIHFEDGMAVVEPGVITGELQAPAARARGLFYPPDPASLKECSLGGNIATNAGGPRCLKYGVTRATTFSDSKSCSPTEACCAPRDARTKTKRDSISSARSSAARGCSGSSLKPRCACSRCRPRALRSARSFRTFRQAANAVQEIFRAGFLPAALEIADAFTLRSAREHLGKAIVPAGEGHALIDLDGQAASVKRSARAHRPHAKNRGSICQPGQRREFSAKCVWALWLKFSNSPRKLPDSPS